MYVHVKSGIRKNGKFFFHEAIFSDKQHLTPPHARFPLFDENPNKMVCACARAVRKKGAFHEKPDQSTAFFSSSPRSL